MNATKQLQQNAENQGGRAINAELPHSFNVSAYQKNSTIEYYLKTKLLLLQSRFSRVRLCATPETAAHQARPSLGFSRQEHWSGVPFPSPMHESEKSKELAQLCPTPSDPMDCSPAGFSIHGIFQARVLEWGAIASSR